MSMTVCHDCGKEISSSAKACPECGAEPKKGVGWKTITAVVLVAFWVLGVALRDDDPQSAAPARTIDPREIALASMEMKNFSWSRGGFGSIMIINFTLANKGQKDIKDFVVHCDLYGQSGTHIDTAKKQILDIVKAGKSRRFKEVNMGFAHSQGTKAVCRVVNLTVI